MNLGGKRGAWIATALVGAMLVSAAVARAGVDMSTGIRYVYQNGTMDSCSSKAKTALEAYLGGANEKTPGSGEWLAYAKPDAAGQGTAAATVRCGKTPDGFVVTFTCFTLSPGSPYSADALCLNIAHNFSGKTVTTLATPTPVPSGCSTTNLVGTWTNDNDGKNVLTMTLTGDVTDQEGVSGNWYINSPGVVTLTYYGNKTMKLSADGKHISGSGASYTRKC